MEQKLCDYIETISIVCSIIGLMVREKSSSAIAFNFGCVFGCVFTISFSFVNICFRLLPIRLILLQEFLSFQHLFSRK